MGLRSRLNSLRHSAPAPDRAELESLRARVDTLEAELRRLMELGRHETNLALLEVSEATDRLVRDHVRLAEEQARLSAVAEAAEALATTAQARSDAVESQLNTFDPFIRSWVEEYVQTLRSHLETRSDEVIELGLGRIEQRIRRLERADRSVREATPQSAGSTSSHTAPTVQPSSPASHETPTAPAPTVSELPPGFSYESFEDALRGTRDHVTTLQREHVARIAGLAHEDLPVIDIGCGRGEFLALLGAEGIPAIGVDLDPVFVDDCRDLGLDAVVGDGLAYLAAQPSGSARAVTAFHVVEHLDTHAQLRFLAECRRVLAPGGIVLLETPNPENLSVGAHSFWLDPTHLRPIPPLLLRFQVEETGFEQVEILRLHADQPILDATPAGWTAEAAERLNRLLSGPMDYAVIGVRPADD